MRSTYRTGALALPSLVLALAITGCVTVDDGGNADAPEVSGASPAAGFMGASLSYEGETGVLACAYALVAGQCAGEFGANAWQDVSFPGEPVAFAGTVEWTPASPLSESLTVDLYQRVGDAWVFTERTATGGSPLAFEWDLTTDSSSEYALHVWAGDWQDTMVGGGGYIAPQPFTVDANLTAKVPAGGP